MSVRLRKRAVHLPPTHWASPFTFLEVRVFLPKTLEHFKGTFGAKILFHT